MKFGLNDDVVKQLNEILSQFKHIEVIIYGSRALGTARDGSDIDLCIKVENNADQIMNRLYHEFDDSYIPHKVDLSLHHEIDNPQLLEHIDSKGQLFYKSK